MKKRLLTLVLSLLILSSGLVQPSWAEEDQPSEAIETSDNAGENTAPAEQVTDPTKEEVPLEDQQDLDQETKDEVADADQSAQVQDDSPLAGFLKGSDSILRVQGPNRVATAIALSRVQTQQSTTVILASALSYPDALAAASLSQGSSMILLVQDHLDQALQEELVRLAPESVLILGGQSTLGSHLEAEIQELLPQVQVLRLAGADRYETSEKVFDHTQVQEPVFVSGDNFPDALAASIRLQDRALILVPSQATSYFHAQANFPRAEIVGGPASVSQALADYLRQDLGISVQRYQGSNRYATSVALAQTLDSKVALVASGQNYPDALAAASLSQRLGAPILLVENNHIPKEVLAYLKEGKVEKLILLGGPASISSRVEQSLALVLKGQDPLPDPLPDLEADVVSLAQVDLYADSQLTQPLSVQIPKNKIVQVLAQEDFSLKLNLYGQEGWAKKDQFKNYRPKDLGKIVNKVPYISQLHPVYAPNGCEPTALLMGLKGKGYTKIGLRAYLDAMPKTSSNPKYGYVGVPYNVEQGRFQTIDPEPLAKYGRKYGPVANIQGASIEEIIKEIQNGNTVVVYATLYWNRPFFRYLPIDGKRTRRIWNNHAVLLTGYDPEKKSFYVADPYNHEKAGGNRRRPFYYWKSQETVDRCYNYDNRRFSLVVR